MNATLERCLADLEERLDESQETALLEQWAMFLEGKCPDPVFTPQRTKPRPAKVDWPKLHINDNDILEDFDTMILAQFCAVSEAVASNTGNALNVRCNYGTGIMPSLFGCEMFVMPRETFTLPTAKAREDIESIRKLVEAGKPDINAAFGGKVFACAERFMEIFRRYPKIAKFVQLYHPDVQGPIDAVEVIWGSSIFYAFYDEPDLVKDMLTLVTDTYIDFLRKWWTIAPRPEKYSAHWGFMHKGALVLRNDSLMNLSPDTYVEYVRPCDQRIFDEFGGGVVHACGKIDHYIAEMSKMQGLTGFNTSQPDLNDMEKVYASTVDKGIKLLGMTKVACEAALATNRLPPGQVHCSLKPLLHTYSK